MRMSKNNKTTLPKLRFWEFKDAPKWVLYELGNKTACIEKRAGTKKYTLMSITSGVGLVPQIEKFGREIAGNAYKNYYVIRKNDFAYNKSATKLFPEGYIAMLTDYDEAALPNSIFTCFRIVDEECCPEFFSQLFQANYHGAWLRKFIAIGARAHGSLNVDDKYLWDMPIALPKLKEQQKIADCLSSVDNLITAETDKLETLKTHKKGLMQKLFPAKGKTLPEWRFPEFRDNEKWQVAELGTIFANRQETGVSLPLMSLTEDLGIIPQTDSNKKDNSNSDKSKYLKIGIGDVVYNTMRMWQGRCAYVDIEGIVSPAYTVCTPQGNHRGLFFYYYFKTSDMVRKFHANSQGLVNDTLSIKYDTFSKIVIFCPDESEQQKIADCLSSLDKLIKAQLRKVEALKLYKNGLMQSLFPSIEEITNE